MGKSVFFKKDNGKGEKKGDRMGGKGEEILLSVKLEMSKNERDMRDKN